MPETNLTDIDPLRLVDPLSYAKNGYPFDEWAQLRREDPVAHLETPGWSPFWAITKHAHIVEVSKQPDKFLNEPGMTFVPDSGKEQDALARQIRTIINMDPPEHRAHRKVAAPHLTPRAIARIAPMVQEIAIKIVDGLGSQGECDMVTDVASIHPLKVICRILGVPEEAEPMILRLTNELFGNADPEFQRSEEGMAGITALFTEFWTYFGELMKDRRAHPTDDLSSVFANAMIDGKPMGELETLGYCLVAFTAGHETTRGGLAGGIQILSERPDLIEWWKQNPDLTPLAIDEIIRYVTPVNHMVRTAAVDYTLAGKQIEKGDKLVLFYASANRDEDAFDAPDEIRLDRNPNRHLSFGVGEHFCVGSHLARLTSGTLLSELVSRLELLEPSGEPQRTASNLVPGFKHLPMRYRLAPRALR